MVPLRTRLLLVVLPTLLALAACAGEQQPTTSTDIGKALTGSLEEQWQLILEQGRKEGRVNFEMWCGGESINRWIDTFVTPEMQHRHGIAVKRVCVAGSPLDRVLAEQRQGAVGANDVLWTNGATSYQMISQGLFYGPVAYRLPNFLRYYDVNAPDLVVDFGYPHRGYETPYTRTQFTLFYDAAGVGPAPRTLDELKRWIKEHPGRFTYPNPDADFTGEAFLKTVFYATNASGDYQPFLAGGNQQLLERSWGPTWDWFNEVKPYLWRAGETYPETLGQLEALYQNGEVDWTMSYGPARGSQLIAEGKAPRTTRGLVLADGTVANANFLAIYATAPHKAAGMVLLNFMMSPEAQHSLSDPRNWGDMPTIDLARLPPDWRARFEALERGPATPPLGELLRHALPEMNAAYAEPLQQGWVRHVLRE